MQGLEEHDEDHWFHHNMNFLDKQHFDLHPKKILIQNNQAIYSFQVSCVYGELEVEEVLAVLEEALGGRIVVFGGGKSHWEHFGSLHHTGFLVSIGTSYE